jgi:hypothetical protein
MSNFFGDASDSDESIYDDSDVEVPEEDDEQLNAGFNKWLKQSDDDESGDDDGNNRGLVSNKDKANDKISNIAENIDFNFGDDWVESHELFTEMAKLAAEYANKFKTRSVPFLTSLQQCVTILQDHTEETKETFEGDNRAWKSFQAVAKMVGERALECAKDLERLASGEEEEDAEEEDDKKKEDWTETGMIEMLQVVVTKPKARANRCDRIMVCAEQQGHKHIIVAAAALVCSSRLAEDPNPNFVSTKTWRRAHDALAKALTVAEENPSLTVAENDTEFNLTARRTLVSGGFYSLACNLHKEVVKGCQFTEGSSPLYFQRVIDENDAAVLLDRVLAYYVKKGLKKAMVRVAMSLLEIVSPRRLAAHAALQGALKKKGDAAFLTDDLIASIETLHNLVMSNNADSETEAIATLYVIYNHAIRDEYYPARDLMLRSRLHEYYQLKSETFRVLFNRVIVHLGMCAFRVGLFNESISTLSELCQKTGRELRELIGQKEVHKVRAGAYDEKKELEDRDRLVPPHQQVSADLVEKSNLVLSMLSDVVTETKSPFERTQRSKHFFNLCKRQGNMALNGKPADDLEKIFAASTAIQEGAVEETLELLMSLDTWKHVHDKENTLKMLEERIKIDCLKVFVITYGSNYESLTLTRMASKFMLSADVVRSQVSRLLLDNTILGHWDQAEACLTIERGTLPRLHHLVRECNERVGHFTAYNDSVAHVAAHGAHRSDHRSGRSMWGGRGRGRGRGGGGPQHNN